MKLIRFGNLGKERPGILHNDGMMYDVSASKMNYDESFFGSDGLERLRKWFALNRGQCPIVHQQERLGPPICRPSKMICVGLNYKDHALESKLPTPEEPIIFAKPTSAICGPNDPLILPLNSTKTDYEAELAFVIGKEASYVSPLDAFDHIAGYLLHNDYSERSFQLERGGQWIKGKGCDTFAPLGPFLVTEDEVTNPNDLQIWLKLNGKIVQEGSTSDMIFNVPYILSYISQFMRLLPGDVISTGTPSGVGMGKHPPRYLISGDVVDLGIEGLGSSRQVVTSYQKKS